METKCKVCEHLHQRWEWCEERFRIKEAKRKGYRRIIIECSGFAASQAEKERGDASLDNSTT